MIKDITIPEIGENVESGDVVDVLVKVGDKVTLDQGIIELETDKAVVEIPSPESGVITEILVKVGDRVEIGQVVARLESSGRTAEEKEAPKATQTAPGKKEAPVEAKPREKEPEKEPEPEEMIVDKKAGEAVGPAVSILSAAEPAPAAPSVRRLARELGADINVVPGSGPGGRISADDVKKFVKGIVLVARGAGVEKTVTPPLPDFGQWGLVERQPITRVRRLTAESMIRSWTVVPHVTQFDEADITGFETFRKKFGPRIQKSGGKLTVTALLLKIITEALKTFPQFNASLDLESGEIIFKKYYHIGVAVATDRGLLVPVIKNTERKNLEQLAVELTDISERTRKKKINPDELEGGTFTISNQGGIGGVNFTPIVYWPQVAILGVSRSSIKSVYLNGQPEPRVILPISLSYDHRVIDGADAARFLKWVAEALEHPLVLCFEK
ncbi:MAG: 2-oxo acid dehydrogenase subunit E2 [Candidatus Zixiibacteriota bacterium]